jgi:Putative peptidoglycan binding domain
MSDELTAKRAGRMTRRIALVFSAAMIACAGAAISPLHAANTRVSPETAQTQQARKKSKKKKPRHEPGQKAPTADRIQEIQGALAREGYYQGDPSGKWDDGTQDAIRRFQEEHALTGSGKIDAPTLQKLGLGSDIAGVSAPRPMQQHPADQSKPASPATPSVPASSAPTSPSATVRQVTRIRAAGRQRNQKPGTADLSSSLKRATPRDDPR